MAIIVRNPDNTILADIRESEGRFGVDATATLLERVRKARAQYREFPNDRQVRARNYLRTGNPDVLAKPYRARDLPAGASLAVELNQPRNPGESFQFNPTSNNPFQGSLKRNDDGTPVGVVNRFQTVTSNAWDKTAGEVVSATADTTEAILDRADSSLQSIGSVGTDFVGEAKQLTYGVALILALGLAGGIYILGKK